MLRGNRALSEAASQRRESIAMPAALGRSTPATPEKNVSIQILRLRGVGDSGTMTAFG